MQKTALLFDGSRFFFALQQVGDGRQFDYKKLEAYLLAQLAVKKFDLALFFTAYNPANEGQARFVNFISTAIGWETICVTPSEACLEPPGTSTDANHSQAIRFDARIAFALGRITTEYQQAIIISDSYALAAPAGFAAAKGLDLRIAMFGSVLDPRWHQEFRRSECVMKVFELAKELDLSSKELLSSVKDLGFTTVTNQLSGLTPYQVNALKNRAKNGPRSDFEATGVPKLGVQFLDLDQHDLFQDSNRTRGLTPRLGFGFGRLPSILW